MREYSNMKAIILDMYGVIVKQTGDNFMKKKVIKIIKWIALVICALFVTFF